MAKKTVSRVQTGVRIERGALKILKSIAAYHEITLSNLLEGMILHNFEGKSPFQGETLALIKALKQSHKYELTSADSHLLKEDTEAAK